MTIIGNGSTPAVLTAAGPADPPSAGIGVVTTAAPNIDPVPTGRTLRAADSDTVTPGMRSAAAWSWRFLVVVSGVVTVLVALVTVGLVKAIIILIVVVAVQQLEAHVLQPLLAVPIVACANAAVKYLVGKDDGSAEGKDTVEMALDKDTGPQPST